MTYEEYLIQENERLKKELEKIKNQNKVKRGDIVFIKMNKQNIEKNSNVQEYSRPYVVISNNIGNYHSNIFICVPMTTKEKRNDLPTHYRISYHDSIVCCEQIFTFNQDRIDSILSKVSEAELKEIEECIKVSIGLKDISDIAIKEEKNARLQEF